MGRTVLVTLWIGIFAISPVDAFAQEAEAAEAQDEQSGDEASRAGARTLFTQGLELAQRRRFRNASQLFRAAYALHRAPAIAYNLASALFELDQLTEAGLLVDSVLDDSDAPENVVEPARDLKRRVRERTGRIEVLHAGSLEGLEIDVDGQRLPRIRIGSEIATTPGTRTVIAFREGTELERHDVEVVAGETVTVTVGGAPTAEEVAARERERERREAERRRRAAAGHEGGDTLTEDWRFWAVVGAGVLAVATVVVIVLTVDFGVEEPIEGNFEPGVIRWD